jgi:hypothetical protein
MKDMKDRLAKIDEEITDERAELVATAGLLDQNDKLREQIQAEERERAKNMIEAEIAAAKIALSAESSNAVEQNTVLNEKLEKLQVDIGQQKMLLQEKDQELEVQNKYANGLEEKLTDAEVLLEAAQQEIATRDAEILTNTEKVAQHSSMQTELEALRTKVEMFENTRYDMFRSLMDQFNVERKELLQRYCLSQDLLKEATQDVMHLASQNSKLEQSLEQALLWEPKQKK